MAESLKLSGAFRNIYKATLAIDCLLTKLPKSALPPPSTLRGVVQQVPILATVALDTAAIVQLRRFIECAFWLLYFSEHRVEWLEFQSNPGKAIQKDQTKPISYNAHREPSFYRNYARERFDAEPSGLAVEAVNALSAIFGSLSSAAHGASAVRADKLSPPLRKLSEQDQLEFCETYRKVAGSGAILLFAFHRPQFNKLPAVYRAWFDWLVGPSTSKAVKAGPFGLAPT
jgi:hypothetical protein